MPSSLRDLPTLKELLEAQYPRAYRIAVALCGDPLLARAVTRDVLRQSLRVHVQWKDDIDASRWFAHHTVLTARQAIAGQRPDPANDAALSLSSDPLFTTILRT